MTDALHRTAVAVLLIASTLSVGCAHQIAFDSDRKGAEVLIDGEVVCTTPCTHEVKSGPAEPLRVEVREGTKAARFDLDARGFASAPIAGGVAAGIGMGMVGAVMTFGGLTAYFIASLAFTGAILAVTLGATGAALLTALALGGATIVALFAYAFGAQLLQNAPRVAMGIIGELGRVPDDTVYVDFKRREIFSDPEGRIEPLVGVSSGYEALLPPSKPLGEEDDFDDEYEDDDYEDDEYEDDEYYYEDDDRDRDRDDRRRRRSRRRRGRTSMLY